MCARRVLGAEMASSLRMGRRTGLKWPFEASKIETAFFSFNVNELVELVSVEVD